MAEKTLHTRIALKIDTLENWEKSALGLKKGELAIATVAASAGTGLTEPVCMLKIGEDGIKTFKDLEWNVYAKASDVLSACKNEDHLRTFINGVIADAGIASSDAMEALAGRVSAVEGLVGDTKVADQISNAIANLNLADTYDAKGAAAQALTDANDYADVLDQAMDVRMQALEAKFGDGEGNVESQIAAAVEAEAEIARAAEKANADAIDVIEADYLKSDDKITLQNQIDANDNAIAALQGLIGDTSVSTQISDAVAVEKTRAEAAEKANSDAIAVLNSNADIEGSVDYKIAQKFSTLIENPDDAMNSIQELVDWTTEHAEDALAMSNQVTANKNAIDVLNGTVSTTGSIDKKIADAIAAENLSQYATDMDLNGVNIRLQDVEIAIGENGSVAGDIADAIAVANEYTDDEVKKLADGVVANNASAISALETKVGDTAVAAQIEAAIEALKISDYAKAADLIAAVNQHSTDKVALEEEIANKANDNDLAPIAKSGNVADLVQTDGDYLVLCCGSSSEVV